MPLFLDDENLEIFLKTIEFESIDALMKEMEKYGRYDPHPRLDKQLCRAFTFSLVFANCEGYEDTIFPNVGDEAVEPTSASIVALSLKKAPNGGAGLTLRAVASWSGISIAKGVKAEWLSSDDISAIPNKKLREAIEGVKNNWSDMPNIALNYDVFPDIEETTPDSVEETNLSCEPMTDQQSR